MQEDKQLDFEKLLKTQENQLKMQNNQLQLDKNISEEIKQKNQNTYQLEKQKLEAIKK